MTLLRSIISGVAVKDDNYIALLRGSYAIDTSPLMGELERIYVDLSRTVAEVLRERSEWEQLGERIKQLTQKHQEISDRVRELRAKADDISVRIKDLTKNI